MASNASGTPLGLQKLMAVDRLSIWQRATYFGNKYVVRTENGEILLKVKEDTSALHAFFGDNSRSFNMFLYDANDQQVIRLRRPYTFGSSKIEVSVCGVVTSVVREMPTLFAKKLSINNAKDQPVLRVKGPWASSIVCDFKLQTTDKIPIGCIRKQRGGFLRDITNLTQFHISFPKDLDVNYKATVIGTCLLIDFLYYGG